MAAAVAGVAVLGGCAGRQEDEAGAAARDFTDPTGAAAARCDLLAPATRAALEADESARCTDVIADLPLAGGAVEAVEVWGGNAQVRLTGDTVFLTETDAGWRVTAAACRPRAQAPYHCDVEGP